MQFPDLILGFYDLVMSFDHQENRAWVFSSGYPAADHETHAEQRLAWLLNELNHLPPLAPLIENICDKEDISANFTSASYQAAVSKVIDYILAGDIFEANISQRFKAVLPAEVLPFQLYRRLRYLNPAPFAAFLNFGQIVLASASPERFLKVSGKHVEARPIKGTRKRGNTTESDARLAQELLHSEKDHAENVMIVDLLRNDLSRVCEDHSVKVTQLCGLESYAAVHHLVSVVNGTLRENFNVIDLLRASFPGGSITGAPKVRAIDIIAEIEPTQRGAYCGSIGYIGFNGDMDFSITIRTFAIKNNIATFQAGGAIVADSEPEEEYAETLTKAQALKNALTLVVEHDSVN
jgi:para-aminobenzoate synthetase component 1